MVCLSDFEYMLHSLRSSTKESVEKLHEFVFLNAGNCLNCQHLSEFEGFDFDSNDQRHAENKKYVQANLSDNDLVCICNLLGLSNEADNLYEHIFENLRKGQLLKDYRIEDDETSDDTENSESLISFSQPSSKTMKSLRDVEEIMPCTFSGDDDNIPVETGKSEFEEYATPMHRNDLEKVIYAKKLQKGATFVKGPLLGIRHLQALLIFLDIVVVYIGRLNIGIALVAMTNADTSNPDFPEYDWNEMDKSFIISSFYWGYVLTQFPGGYICRRFGAKITMFVATFGSAVCSLIIPFCIPWGGWQVYCVIRILQGFFQGMVFPCIHEHLAKWSPFHERNQLGALSHTGMECGTVLAMSTSGFIAAGSMGWPGISYIAAGLGFAWCALWLLFASNTAANSKYISAAERNYIESSLMNNVAFEKQKISVPWRAIWLSVPFHALIIVRYCQAWGFTTMQAQIPSYMNGVLNMDIKSNAFYSGLPYLAMWALSYVYVISADILQKKQLLSLSALRKTINSFALWIPAACLIAIGFLDQQQKPWAIVLMTLNVGLNCGSIIGSSLNTIDLSPNYAGVLMGIVNTVANIIAILTPLVVGLIVTDEHDRTQWQIVFLITAVIFFIGNLIYIVWGTTNVQPWNDSNFDAVRGEEDVMIREASSKRISKALYVPGRKKR